MRLSLQSPAHAALLKSAVMSWFNMRLSLLSALLIGQKYERWAVSQSYLAPPLKAVNLVMATVWQLPMWLMRPYFWGTDPRHISTRQAANDQMSTGMGFQMVGSRTGKLGVPGRQARTRLSFCCKSLLSSRGTEEEEAMQLSNKTKPNYPKSKQKARSMPSWTSIQLQN